MKKYTLQKLNATLRRFDPAFCPYAEWGYEKALKEVRRVARKLKYSVAELVEMQEIGI